MKVAVAVVVVVTNKMVSDAANSSACMTERKITKTKLEGAPESAYLHQVK